MKEYKKKFGILYINFREENIIQSGYFGIIGLKKLIYGFIMVFFNDYPIFNLLVFILLSSIIIYFNMKYKIFKHRPE